MSSSIIDVLSNSVSNPCKEFTVNPLLCFIHKAHYVNKTDSFVLHKKLGHPCEQTLKNIYQKIHLTTRFTKLLFCKECQLGKCH